MSKDVWLCGYVIGVEVITTMDRKDVDQFREDLWDTFPNLQGIEETFDGFILEFENVPGETPDSLIDRIKRVKARYLKG